MQTNLATLLTQQDTAGALEIEVKLFELLLNELSRQERARRLWLARNVGRTIAPSFIRLLAQIAGCGIQVSK